MCIWIIHSFVDSAQVPHERSWRVNCHRLVSRQGKHSATSENCLQLLFMVPTISTSYIQGRHHGFEGGGTFVCEQKLLTPPPHFLSKWGGVKLSKNGGRDGKGMWYLGFYPLYFSVHILTCTLTPPPHTYTVWSAGLKLWLSPLNPHPPPPQFESWGVCFPHPHPSTYGGATLAYNILGNKCTRTPRSDAWILIVEPTEMQTIQYSERQYWTVKSFGH